MFNNENPLLEAYRDLHKDKVRQVKKDAIQDAQQTKFEAQEIAEKNEANELFIVYSYMQKNPNEALDCHSINKILNKGTNIASRIFRKLEAADLIYYFDSYANDEQSVKTMHYKIKDTSVQFNYVKLQQNLDRVKRIADMHKKINDIVERTLNQKFDEKELRFIYAMLMYVVKSIQNNTIEERNIQNLFNKENFEHINVKEALTLLTNLTLKL